MRPSFAATAAMAPLRQCTRHLRRILGVCVLALFGLIILPAHAHKPSDSYLSLDVAGQGVQGQWDIALRDLEYAIGLDSNGDGGISWGEVQEKHQDLAAYALSRLALSANGTSCPAQVSGHLIDHHTDGAYAVLRFSADCAGIIEQLDIQYNLLFDLDPQHKGLLKLTHGGLMSAAIFNEERTTQQFNLTEVSRIGQFTDYVRHGIWHIWIGLDHILFLVSLLLPAVLLLRQRQWYSTRDFQTSLIDVLKIVTAFTVAHSLTLTLAALQIVALPSRWVESAIAASVVIAAVNNVAPFFQGQRWLAAFVFGLVHGFGFANVLSDLGLPQSALMLSLVGFNVGVEIGQLTIVAVCLPLAYAVRKTGFYRHFVLTGGSVGIALLATVWMVERALDLQLMPS